MFDTYFDQSCEDWEERQWDNVRLFKNKFDLAIQYPHVADQIIDLPSKTEIDGIKFYTTQHVNETADIPVYYFYHKKTHSMPNGRLLIYASQDCVLYDGPIPYRELPLKRIVPGEIFGSTEGYSDAFDLIGIQEALNVLISLLLPINKQTVFKKYGFRMAGISLPSTMLSKGLTILRGLQGAKPKTIQLTATAREIFEMIPFLQKQLETLSGINGVPRESTNDLGKNASGLAIAFVQAMAVQYNSMFQESWAELNEDVATHCLEILQDYVTTEREVALVDKRPQGAMKSFTGQDLKPIERVKVFLGNPMMRTFSGKLQTTETLLAKGLIKPPNEYLTIIETGNIGTSLQALESEIDLIHKENDSLRDGKPVQALVGDAHHAR